MEFLNEKGTMPISGFYGPHNKQYVSPKGWQSPDYLVDEYYGMIKESGINLICYTEMDYKKEPVAVRKALQLAEKYDLCMYVKDSKLSSDMTIEELAEHMKAYRQFKSFKGIHICDEPGSQFYGPKERMLEEYCELASKIHSFPGLIGYTNLFAYHPGWIGVNGNTIWRTRDCYESYVDAYCNQFHAQMLSEDYYIFDDDGVEKSKYYFENLEIMKQYSQKYNIPYWICVQLGGQWNDMEEEKVSTKLYPHPTEVIWNVNTALAYGAKGITYFPLLQPMHFAYAANGEMDFTRNGLITANGEKSAWFECVQEANAQIKAVGKYLLQMTHKEMVVEGYYASLNLPKAKSGYGPLQKVVLGDKENQYGTVIGCFECDEGFAYYVVNNDVCNAQEITLQFEKVNDIELLSAKCVEKLRANNCTLKLEASDACLVILK